MCSSFNRFSGCFVCINNERTIAFYKLTTSHGNFLNRVPLSLFETKRWTKWIINYKGWSMKTPCPRFFDWTLSLIHVVSSKFERPHCNEGINLTYPRFSAGREERNIVAGARKNRGKTRVLGRLSSTYSSLAFVFNPSSCTNWEPYERANIDHDHKRYLYKNCLSQV